jgi:hypothetical protein
MMGLHGFTETMRGTWSPSDGSGRRVLWFRLDADATNAFGYMKAGEMQLDGTFFAEGLANEVATRGRMEVQPLRRRIAYRLEFKGDDGKAYRFVGEKRLNVLRLLSTMTTLPGEITDAHGARVGTALVRFDARRDLLPFLRTFRLAESGRHSLLEKPA